jgi:amidase
VLEINPEALYIAEALDIERLNQGPRGPLHGIPILLKDNINTGNNPLKKSSNSIISTLWKL